MNHLILGGARSGKSRFAQELAAASGLPVTVIATGQARDAEMAARIARHQAERPAGWRTVEEPLHLAAALAASFAPSPSKGEGRGGGEASAEAHPPVDGARAANLIVVDCLTLWLLNLLEAGEDVFQRERAALLAALPELPGDVLLVANEVGLGVIPMGELTRRYVDEAGWLNQDIARLCERVTLVAAGLPLNLKPAHP